MQMVTTGMDVMKLLHPYGNFFHLWMKQFLAFSESDIIERLPSFETGCFLPMRNPQIGTQSYSGEYLRIEAGISQGEALRPRRCLSSKYSSQSKFSPALESNKSWERPWLKGTFRLSVVPHKKSERSFKLQYCCLPFLKRACNSKMWIITLMRKTVHTHSLHSREWMFSVLIHYLEKRLKFNYYNLQTHSFILLVCNFPYEEWKIKKILANKNK